MDAKLRARLETGVVNALAAASAPMAWGVDDCALWCANVVRDALGYDPARKFRGRYATRNGARRALGPRGLKGALRVVARRHGWQRIDPAMAQPGDWGLTWTAINARGRTVHTLATVMCRSNGWFVGRSELGFTALRADKVVIAWSLLDDVRPGARTNLAKMSTRPVLVPTSAVAHDPVSAFAAVAAIYTAITSTAIGTFIATAALSVGFSLAASLLSPHTGGTVDPTLANMDGPQAIQVTERQSLPSKRVILGNAYVGGALFFEQVKPPYLYQGILINHGPITSVDKIFIGTNQLGFSALTPNAVLTPIAIDGQPDYPDNLIASLRYGSSIQTTDPIIAADFPHISTNLIPGTTGTTGGNMTGSGGNAAAFDGQPIKLTSACATESGTGNLSGSVSKDWGSGVTKTIERFRVHAPVDNGFSLSTDNNEVTLFLEGSTDNFSSSIVPLYNVGAESYSGGAVVDILADIIDATAYRYHRVRVLEIAGDGTTHEVAIAQVELFTGSASGVEFSQRGIATAVLRYNFGATQAIYTALWGQVERPSAYFVVRGVPVYDPRDPSQDMNDPTTWKFTNNATLLQTFYLTQSWGGRIPLSKIRWDKIVESANYDDTVMACADGTYIPRHTIDGAITLDQSPSDVLPTLLTANRAIVLQSGGMAWVQSSQPLTPIATIYDGILTGGITYQAAKAKKDLVNKIQQRFVSPDQDYQVVDGPILDRTDLQAIDGEVLPATLALNFTQDDRRAQRLAKAFLESSRLGRTITCTVDTSLLATVARNGDDLIGNVVTFNSALFGAANGNYRVTSVGFSDDFSTLSLALAEYDPTIETDWNPGVDEQPFVIADLTTS